MLKGIYLLTLMHSYDGDVIPQQQQHVVMTFTKLIPVLFITKEVRPDSVNKHAPEANII